MLFPVSGWLPSLQSVRRGSKAVTRHRRATHILRQKLLAVTEYIPPKPAVPDRCSKPWQRPLPQQVGIERFLQKEVEKTLRENKMIAVFQNNSITSEELQTLRYRLMKHDVHMKFFPNQVLRSYLADSRYKNLLPLIIGPNIMIVSKEPKARELLQTVRSTTQVTLLGACIENVLLSRQGLVTFSRLPGIQTIRGQLVGSLSLMGSHTCQLLQSGSLRLSALLHQYLKQQQQSAPEGQ
uniref:Large ribosomal subunit protein uL10m n=1 Tax=Callorhinchus milii TaxID=7868 RepID=A0A4W3JWP9_CALMI